MTKPNSSFTTCFNFAKGSCRLGSDCRYVHDSNVKPTNTPTDRITNNTIDELLGASSHLNNSVNSLSENFNTCMYPSISVGDGHSIPVTNTGHSILLTPTKSLHLNNDLITPHIVKNLISVRQFVRDNNRTIEFDAFDIFVKDFLTRRVLLRCDNTRDLYPVTVHLISFMLSLLVNTHGINVLDTQGLDKHVRLPFVRSGTVISSCFDIIHSDVYPLVNKSNVMSKLVLFRNYVRTQFKCEIKSFQCDHGAQQSPTAAPPTPASPSSAQIHSPVQQPSPMAQHTPIQLQFSPTAVSHQTTTVSHQHAPAIIQNPSVNPNSDPVHPMVTRFRVRTNRPTERLNLHVSSVSPLPKSYRDAFNDPNWQNAMRDEYTALLKTKLRLYRYKARLAANGSTQLEGVDVDEIFSPVVKPGIIRTVLSLATSRHWPIHQLDVKNAFLQTVYMHQPLGFRDSAHPDYVCLLHRSLYGLKQGIDIAYLYIYVDDIVLTASSEGLLQRIIGSLHQEFATTDLGPLNYFLGFSLTRDSSGLFLSQKKYAIEILEKAHMVSCNPSRTPVDTESKLGVDGDPISNPTLYRSLADLVAYYDADWAGCPTTRRSTSEYCVFLGNNLLSWNLLCELHTPLSSATLVYCDNVSALYLLSNPVQHQRTKHIEIDIHFVRDLVAVGQVRVLHVPSRYQFADIFTKGLPSTLFEEFRWVQSPPAPTAGGVSCIIDLD
uniref:C3H1-type domain-containing protein n=1 Tax=Tanacetum cinerariifolium TaxID=118510 RepID=A0A6L2N811_TANCI|nr:hypothetical protein [Tanacetum cinerariifolium]